MVDKFTVHGASEQPIPWSCTKPRRVLVPYWTEECWDAIQARKHALRTFRRHPTVASLIAFKRLCAREQRTLRQSKHHSWESLSLLWQTPRLPRLYDEYEANVRVHLSQPFWWTVWWSPHRMKWLTRFYLFTNRSQVLPVVLLLSCSLNNAKKATKMAVFWVVAPCSLVEVYQRFRSPCCLHHKGLSDYTALQPRRQPPSILTLWCHKWKIVTLYIFWH
jgi:hypothetical protein